MSFLEWFENNFKKIAIICICVIIVCAFAYLLIDTFAKPTVQEEFTKQILFCENKVGFLEYSWVCDNTGICSKAYLNCDYINMLHNQKIIDENNVDYSKINNAYNENLGKVILIDTNTTS